ncbi:hypothetical protein D3C78_995330 [compost metagenome]
MPGSVIDNLNIQLNAVLRQQRLDGLLNGVELRVFAVVGQGQFGQSGRFGLQCQRAIVVPARQNAVGR